MRISMKRLIALFVPAVLMAAAPGSWTPAGTCTPLRYEHAAGLLADGRVLVTGGSGEFSGVNLTSAKLFKAPATWTDAASMTAARTCHGQTLLSDGRVLVTGGRILVPNPGGGGTYVYLNSAEIYSPTNDTWTPVASMTQVRALHSATLLSNGKVLVAGGASPSTLTSAEVYDPAGNTWTTVASLTYARYAHAAIRLQDGSVLVAATQLGNVPCEIYNPASGSWAITAGLGGGFSNFLFALPDGRFLFFDGTLFLAPSPAGPWTQGPAMPVGSNPVSAALLKDGRLIVTGGLAASVQADVRVYDPVANTWSLDAPLASPRSNHQTVTLPDGRVLVVGGYGQNGLSPNTELYTPAPPRPVALFVVGNTTLTTSDAAIRTEMAVLGYDVVVKSGPGVQTSDAAGKALVVISSTITSADVNTKFKSVAVPVLCFENRLFHQMGMVGAESDEGTSPAQTSLNIVFPDHPLAAGLIGTVAVSNSLTMTWGTPNANAVTIARLAGSTTKAGIFAYDRGSEMPGLVAPARRIGGYFEDHTAGGTLPNGWTLFDAAVRWAVEPPKAPTLFVVGNLTLGGGDAAVQRRLQLLGYPVVLRTDSASSAASAVGKSVVLVSSTVTSANVNTKFKAAAVPVMTWESALGGTMGMTGPVSGADYGTSASQTSLTIQSPAHPLAAGLSGSPTVVSSPRSFSWGVPNANAVSIASLAGNSARKVIFGYDTGAAMFGLAAPARRLAFFLEDVTAVAWNASGQTLFDAALAWSVATSAPPVPGSLVQSFGTGGAVVVDAAEGQGLVDAFAVDGPALFAGGSFLPAAGGGSRWRVEKRNAADGALIPGFGSAGVVQVPTGGAVVALVVSGSSIFLAGDEMVGVQPSGIPDIRWRIEKRSTATGALDSGFGTAGVVVSNPSPYVDLPRAAVADGTHLYVAGFDNVPLDPAGANRQRWRIEKIRLDTGAPDAGFGSAGVVVIDQTTRVDEAFTLLLAGGALYAGGYQAANSTGQWRVEKRNPVDGALDPAFGTGGAVLSDLSLNHDEVKRLGTDGSALIVAGTVSQLGGNDFWRVERRDLATGALIPAFGTGGAVTTEPGPNSDQVEALAVDANGLYVMGRDSSLGFDNIQWRIEKRSPATGAFDAAFGTGGTLLENPTPFNDLLLAAHLDGASLYLGGGQGLPGFNTAWKIEKRNH
jgi:uncharacterized delta-60 repeat protein